MQLAGARFTDASAAFGNDLATLPNFPAEIRAPAGTLPGVSAFQIHIAEHDILTPGDKPDVLVAMNPAALKKNLADVRPGGTILINTDTFEERNLAKADYEANPLEDGTLDGYTVLAAPMDELTKLAVKESGVKGREVLRSKNFFALGALAWMFDRPTDVTLNWVKEKFANKPEVAAVNTMAFQAGYNFGITTEAFAGHTYEVPPADLPAGTYTNVIGSQTIAWGLIAGARAAGGMIAAAGAAAPSSAQDSPPKAIMLALTAALAKVTRAPSSREPLVAAAAMLPSTIRLGRYPYAKLFSLSARFTIDLAMNRMTVNLAISDGCRENPPSVSHRRAPPTSLLSAGTMTASNKRMVAAMIGNVSFSHR